MEKFGISDQAACSILSKGETKGKIKVRGEFEIECFNHGSLRWKEKFSNIITNEGLNHILDVTLAGGTQHDPWYVVIFEDNYTPTEYDNYVDKGFTETTAYDEAVRPTYVDVVSGEQSTNSASKATFTINDTKTIYGAALVGGSNVKSDTAESGAKLLCSAQFASERAVVSGDSLNVTYTLTASDDGV